MSVINLGSINIDHCYRVPHFVRPGETLLAGEYQQHLGGKGLNQSVALHRAGARVCHVGAVGIDSPRLLGQLADLGLDTEAIATVAEATGHALIQIDQHGENCIVLHAGANHALSLDSLALALRLQPESQWLLLQNETNLIEQSMRWAKQQGLKVAFNPAPAVAGLADLPLECLSLLSLNQVELSMLTGVEAREPALTKLQQRCPQALIVLTLGAEGVIAWQADQRYQVAAEVVEVVDTTAAGDTFVGYLLAALSQDQPVGAAIKLASQAAALSVTQQGAVPSIPTLQAVEAAFA